MNKKTAALSLALLLLLPGCQNQQSAAPMPVSTPIPTPTATPASSLEDMEPWWVGIDLEDLPTEEEPVYQAGDVTWRLTCAEPALDLALYDVSKRDLGVQFVLRHGEDLGEVYRSPGVSSDAFYSLHAGDFDGDGEREFAVGMYRMFVLCELDGENCTALVYDESQYVPQIQSALEVQLAEDSVTLYCGGSSAVYRPSTESPGRVGFQENYSSLPFWFTFSDDSIRAVFPVMGYVEESHTGSLFATLRYTLAYDGHQLTAQNFQLEDMAGV